MKSVILGLVVVATLFLSLPPAYALNCTKFKGDERSLCKEVNILPIKESDKRALMNPNLYEETKEETGTDFSLNLSNNPQFTLESIYEDKIIIIGKFAVLILTNYSLFSILTKSFIRKWLAVS